MTQNNTKQTPFSLHASAISYNGKGIVFVGESGSGKSDMTLRMVDRGASLIGDDRVLFIHKNKSVIVMPHPEIAGQIEVRGVGICKTNFVRSAPLAMIVRLMDKRPERYPEPMTFDVLEKSFPMIELYPFEPSAVIKLCMAFDSLVQKV